MKATHVFIGISLVLGLYIALPPANAQNSEGLGALAPENLAKERQERPFDLTGVWRYDTSFPPARGVRQFLLPEEGVELTPEAQAHHEAALQAIAEGKSYRNDIGLCWPMGLPIMMARAWPVYMIQLPTAIYMIQELMNDLRVVYTDGRSHTDPDLVVPSWSGESIGHWEDNTLVVDTRNFVDHHHWIHDREGIPASDELQIIERMRMPDDDTLQIEYTFRDPKVFEGEWVLTRQWVRVNDRDIQEVHCLPNLNEHLPTTQNEEYNIREEE